MLPLFLDELYRAGGAVHEVGGCLRDQLLGIPHKDSDLVVTRVPMERLLSILKRFGEVYTVGKSFGVIKFYPKGMEADGEKICLDIALPRKEVSTGAGHRDFEVDYDPSLPIESDLGRRDFTINAMAREIGSQTFIDPFGGCEDLKARKLRMVFDRAFEEDPLRLMRAVQFAARFELDIEPATFERMKENAALIKTVSPERISEEIRKLLSAPKPSVGFLWMERAGLLKDVFPELAENVGVEQGNKKDDVFLHTLKVLDASRRDAAIPLAGDLELMLAALFHDVGKGRTKKYDKEKNRLTFYGHQHLSKRMARLRMNQLKMTTLGINQSRVLHLVEEHMFQTKHYFSDRSIRRFINKIGPDDILKLVDLRIADNRGGKYPEGIQGVLRLRRKIVETLEQKVPFGVKDLAVKGTDLMALGIPEGPEIGRILKELVEVVLDDPEFNTLDTLLKIVKERLPKSI